MYLGDSGAGKTGSLASLAGAGYKLRIFDLDNLLGSLVQYIMKDFPEGKANFNYQTFTDKMKGLDTPGMMQGKNLKVFPFVDGQPKAFPNMLKQLNHWRVGDEDLGVPGTWGKECVVVIDTLTTMSDAAFRYCQALNPLAEDQRAVYFSAQQMIIQVLALLASDQFATNVLVLAHIDYDKNQFNLTKGFPRSIGSAMNTKIAPYFNVVLMAEDQKYIKTRSTGIVDLKNPISFKVDEKLPLSTGMADFFKAVTSK